MEWDDSANEYNSGSDFLTALNAQPASGAKVQQVFATGKYDQTSNTLMAELIAVTAH